jgi:hypothetical protein
MGKILFLKQILLILPSSSLKLISPKYFSFWLTIYLLCLVGVFFNRQSVFLWVLFVLHISLISCLFRSRRHTGASDEERKEASPIVNFPFRYIDDVLSLNYWKFGDFVDRIFSIELEIKVTTGTARSASYLELHFEIDSEGWLRTKLFDNRYHFNFPTVHFPFVCSNIPTTPTYWVYSDIPRFLVVKLKSLVYRYGVYVSQMTTDMFCLS